MTEAEELRGLPRPRQYERLISYAKSPLTEQRQRANRLFELLGLIPSLEIPRSAAQDTYEALAAQGFKSDWHPDDVRALGSLAQIIG